MKAMSIACLLIITVFAEAAAPENQMSVEETLAVATRPYGERLPSPNILGRCNVAARPDLLRYLDDDKREPQWQGSLLVLGYIGTDDDVEPLAAFIKHGVGAQSLKTIGAKHEAVATISRIAVRGSRTANSVLRAMSRPSYWKDIKFKEGDQSTEQGLSEANWYADWALCHLVRMDVPDIQELCDKAVAEIPSSRERDLLRDDISDQIARRAKYNRNTDRHSGLSTTPQEQTMEVQAATQSVTRSVPLDQHIQELLQDKKAARLEAMKAYATIVASLRRRDAKTMENAIAGSGIPFPIRYGGSDAGLRPRESKLWTDIDRSLAIESKTSQIVPADETDIATAMFGDEKDQGVVVKVHLPNTKRLMSEHRVMPVSVTVDHKELCIYMVYLRGTWYWNPFGW